VDITLTGRTLVISGELKADEQVEREQYVYRERRMGTFNRQIQLPVRVIGEKAEASFENGLLRLTIPKAEESKPRSIEIKVPKKAE
jgi:HSP20 family protein